MTTKEKEPTIPSYALEIAENLHYELDGLLQFLDKFGGTLDLISLGIVAVEIVTFAIWLGEISSLPKFLLFAFAVASGLSLTLGARAIMRKAAYLAKWDIELSRLLYVNKFEMNPPRGGSPNERLLNQARLVYHTLNELVEEKPDSVTFNAVVEGKSGKKYLFDVYVHGSYDLKYGILRHLGTGRPSLDFFIKRFEGEVSKKDIEELEENLDDIHQRTENVPHGIIVVTANRFMDDAIIHDSSEYARKGAAFHSLDFIEETENGYKVIYAIGLV